MVHAKSWVSVECRSVGGVRHNSVDFKWMVRWPAAPPAGRFLCSGASAVGILPLPCRLPICGIIPANWFSSARSSSTSWDCGQRWGLHRWPAAAIDPRPTSEELRNHPLHPTSCYCCYWLANESAPVEMNQNDENSTFKPFICLIRNRLIHRLKVNPKGLFTPK